MTFRDGGISTTISIQSCVLTYASELFSTKWTVMIIAVSKTITITNKLNVNN